MLPVEAVNPSLPGDFKTVLDKALAGLIWPWQQACFKKEVGLGDPRAPFQTTLPWPQILSQQSKETKEYQSIVFHYR